MTEAEQPLTIRRDRVALFHYSIRDESGSEIESNRDGAPAAVLYGRGGTLRGVEQALAGRVAGDRFDVRVPPELGFGVRRDDWTERVSKRYFQKNTRLKPGMVVSLRTETGMRTVTVVKVGGKMVDVDLNHPMAGATLDFDIEVVDVREATPEELSHGHVHGPGGHHH